MKVGMELNVSDKEFYDLMMKSLKEEVKNVRYHAKIFPKDHQKNKRAMAGYRCRCPHEPQDQPALRQSGPCDHGACGHPCDLQPV